MGSGISLADYRALSGKDKEDFLTHLTDEATASANGGLAAVQAGIKNYEQRYEMKSAVLLECLSRNEIRETADIARWLYLLGVRERSEQKTRT